MEPIYRCSLCGELTQMPKDMGCPHCKADPCWVFDATLKAGDRVRILTHRRKFTRIVLVCGEIVGESRTKTAWRCKVDHLVYPINFHKPKVERAPAPTADRSAA